MIICHEHRFVFVKTRKTAGTSVEIALAQHAGPRDVMTTFAQSEDNAMRRSRGADAQNQAVPLRYYGVEEWTRAVRQRRRTHYRSHMAARLIKRLSRPGLWEDYFTFTIVRNPWEVAASSYYWLTRVESTRPSFDQFLQSGSGGWNNWPLYTEDGEVIVDEVIRYESLADGLVGITGRLGLPPLELPQAKSGLRSAPYRELYDETTRQIVAEVCRDEIEQFGYTF